ncbi:MAG TPA: hypothetical protein VN207_01010 [Ktedonobacteraceae bacterium]|nr:hypothetical protein [Ktedonobacteraceae bacterium]
MSEMKDKIPDSVQQKAKKAKEDLDDLIRELREQGLNDLAAKFFTDLVDQVLPKVINGSMQTLGTLLQDPDRQERLHIHDLIGNVLAEELKIHPEQGKIVSYYLMNERQIGDLAVNGQLPPPPPAELLQAATRTLLSVKLRYEQRNIVSSRPKSKSSIVSVIEIYLLRPNAAGQSGPTRKELTSDLEFDDMLSGARETWIREGTRQPVIYKLFPRRTE